MPSSKRTSSHHQTSHSSHHPQTQSQNLKAAPVGHDTDSMPQNSITVASRTVPVRARSISSSSTTSPLSSSHSSPAVPTTAKSPVQVAATELSKSINNTTTSPAATANTNSLDSNGNSASLTSNPTAGRQKPQTVTSYDMSSNLEEITMRQLEEDISAYQHDEAFCLAQLEEPDLTPQETRTLQLRILDLGHQVRHCRHRIETIQFQLRKIKPVALGLRPAYNGLGAPLVPASSAPTNGTSVNGPGTKVHVNIKHPSSSGAAGGYIVKRPGAAATPSTGHKRTAESEEADGDVTSGESKKIKTGSSPTPPAVDYEMHMDGGAGVDNVNTALQRLGFWKCRLCSSPKYLLAGSGRTPAAPCKWPLKDISKMITHFTEMHVEHSASERCVELGSALAKNRGPFEYWLRRTRAQNIGDGTMLDECIAHLLQGEMPQLLRRHSRAAASMQQD